MKPVSEKAFMEQVVELAKLCGWSVSHAHDSRRSEPGVPDLMLVRDGVLVFAELKTDAGATTPAQERWLALLAAVPGVRAAVWRPAGWGEVQRVLTGGKG